jgi:hypothetical protein
LFATDPPHVWELVRPYGLAPRQDELPPR